MSDRIAVFRSGVIEQYGAAQDIYRRPASRFVAEFVGETNILVAERDGEKLLIRELGVKVSAPPGLPQEKRFLLSVRPENILLRSLGGDGVSAKVTDTEYGGMILRVEAAVAGRPKPLRVALQVDQAKAVTVGDMVTLGVDLAAAAALKVE